MIRHWSIRIGLILSILDIAGCDNHKNNPDSTNKNSGDNLACDSSDAIDTVASIAKDNQPTSSSLLSTATSEVLAKQLDDLTTEIDNKRESLISQCVNQPPDRELNDARTIEQWCTDNAGNLRDNEILVETQKLRTAAFATAVYSLNTIRMEDKNPTTGATTCAAKLHVEVPKYGAAEEDIEYKLENTTDGKLYATVQGLK